MGTDKKRVNVSLPKPAYKALSFLAKRDDVPLATKATFLIEEALELEEDIALDALALQRKKRGKLSHLSHKQVWRKYGL